MLTGVMHYKAHASSPYHYHEVCEHFYFIMGGKGTVETPEGIRDVVPGDLVFIPTEARHRLRATDTGLFYFEFQAPNRFKTHILDGTPDDLRWNRVDGGSLGTEIAAASEPHRTTTTPFINTDELPLHQRSAGRVHRNPERPVGRRQIPARHPPLALLRRNLLSRAARMSTN
jgi:hypothetical protein